MISSHIVAVVGRRPEVLADALDEVRAPGAAGVHRALRVGADHADPPAGRLLQVAADAADRAAGADAGDEVGDPALGLLPDLRAGRLVVRQRVVRVRVLVRLPAARYLAGQPVGHRVVRPRIIGGDRGRADDHLGAIGPQHVDLVAADLVRADEDAAVAALLGDDREADRRCCRTVGSTIVPPGRSSPDSSAASIIRTAMRSFTEPPGLTYSTLASQRSVTARP